MTRKSESLSTWAGLTLLTLAVVVLRDVSHYTYSALIFIWAFFSWNLIAYGFDRNMWPVTFVELDGHDKGNPLARKVVFWLTAAVYLMLLATIAWA